MKKIIFYFSIPALFLIVFSSCFKDPKPYQQTCNYDPCSFKAPATEIAAVQHFLDSAGIIATQHCSGLFYKINNAGTGDSAVACSNVAVTYKGRFTNGAVFDSSNTAFGLSLGQVIQGWTNGVPLIKEGGNITLIVPPSLGYGPNAYGSIPGNSILVFDIGLVKVY